MHDAGCMRVEHATTGHDNCRITHYAGGKRILLVRVERTMAILKE
jgi:hypothetical protein